MPAHPRRLFLHSGSSGLLSCNLSLTLSSDKERE